MAYTYPEVKVEKQIGAGANATVAAACSATAANSAFINKSGLTSGVVINESGGSVTVAYYTASSFGGGAVVLKDSAGEAVSQTIGDDEALPLPAAAAGAAYIIPKLSSGTANLTFHFEQGS